jgi:2-phospho-L-lactate guanylyltransferase
MQGTVATFEQDKGGSVLLDDGSTLIFGADAFAASGLRLLRLGQRVRIELGPEGVVRRLTLPTLP